MESTITRKGQVTIPKSIRESLGLSQGDRVLFIQLGDKALMVPAPESKDPMRALEGIFDELRPVPELKKVAIKKAKTFARYASE